MISVHAVSGITTSEKVIETEKRVYLLAAAPRLDDPERGHTAFAHALRFGDRGGSQFYRRFLLLHHATDVAIECREHAVRVLLLHGIIENGLRPRFR